MKSSGSRGLSHPRQFYRKYVTPPSRTSDGRIDAVIETDDNIYLFEFKLNDDDTALEQILEKEYYKRYLCSGKKITLIGVNFDTNTGKIRDWKPEEVAK